MCCHFASRAGKARPQRCQLVIQFVAIMSRKWWARTTVLQSSSRQNLSPYMKFLIDYLKHHSIQVSDINVVTSASVNAVTLEPLKPNLLHEVLFVYKRNERFIETRPIEYKSQYKS